jgi:hypothetical protein
MSHITIGLGVLLASNGDLLISTPLKPDSSPSSVVTVVRDACRETGTKIESLLRCSGDFDGSCFFYGSHPNRFDSIPLCACRMSHAAWTDADADADTDVAQATFSKGPAGLIWVGKGSFPERRGWGLSDASPGAPARRGTDAYGNETRDLLHTFVQSWTPAFAITSPPDSQGRARQGRAGTRVSNEMEIRE